MPSNVVDESSLFQINCAGRVLCYQIGGAKYAGTIAKQRLHNWGFKLVVEDVLTYAGHPCLVKAVNITYAAANYDDVGV